MSTSRPIVVILAGLLPILPARGAAQAYETLATAHAIVTSEMRYPRQVTNYQAQAVQPRAVHECIDS